MRISPGCSFLMGPPLRSFSGVQVPNKAEPAPTLLPPRRRRPAPLGRIQNGGLGLLNGLQLGKPGIVLLLLLPRGSDPSGLGVGKAVSLLVPYLSSSESRVDPLCS